MKLSDYFILLIIFISINTACNDETENIDTEAGTNVAESGTDQNVCSDGPCFMIGNSHVGQNQSWKLTVTEADHTPPIQGLNQWTFSLKDSENESLQDCSILVKPYMPEHGHGSRDVEATWVQADQYQVQELDFIMPGLWEITFEVTCADLTEKIVFDFWLNP